MRKVWAYLLTSVFAFSAFAATEQAESSSLDELAAAEAEQAAIAEALNNPLSSLWIMFSQNDTTWYKGDVVDGLGKNDLVMNTTYLQPVMPFQLTENWKAIFRPTITVNSFDTVDNLDVTTGTTPDFTGTDFSRETGLGDTILWTAFSNNYKPPFVWGFGPTVMLPTATNDNLGTGKYAAGPMALAVNITDKWVVGGIAQHWWSFAGDDTRDIDTSLGRVEVDRPDVNLTDFQYILRYRYSALTNIGVAPNVQYNWETDELSLPIGIGIDTMGKFGKLPFKYGAELHYYAVQDDDFGPEWRLRIFFTPVLPAPNWSKKALF